MADKEQNSKILRVIKNNCQIDNNIEIELHNLNQNIINLFQVRSETKSNIEDDDKNNSDTINKIKNSLNEISECKSSLNQLKNEINESFNKLSSILSSRNFLQTILKDFNQNTKDILVSKTKMNKLLTSINNIYKIYEESLSIQNFLNNDNSILKFRFLSDYELIENGINFFNLNSKYTEASKYISIYSTLKIKCINIYYIYINECLTKEANIPPNEDTLLYLLLTQVNEKIRGKYYLYKCQEKMAELILFFQRKSLTDPEIKKSQDRLKQKFIDQRISFVSGIYTDIMNQLYEKFNTQKECLENIHQYFFQIALHLFIEIVYYTMFFGKEFKQDIYIIQNFTNSIVSNLYDNIRPIIVSIVSLENLVILFEAFSSFFGIFFLEIETEEKIEEELKSRILNFWRGMLVKQNIDNKKLFFEEENLKNLNNELKMQKQENWKILLQFLIISKNLIRPTILHLIQDIQEKIYFKIDYHIKNNFLDIESDFPSFSSYEEKLYAKYANFSLFHFFLKRIIIVYEIFQNKLDEKIINQILISSIETFIFILNGEMLAKKSLNYDFQIYIIQQILLCMQIIEKLRIETVREGVEIDFNFLTDMFKNNYAYIISGQFTIGQVLVNSAPKILNKTRDFKKILYSNLLKSYKMLVNLADEFILGRNFVELTTKISNKKLSENDIFSFFKTNYENIVDKIDKIEENENLVLEKINEQLEIIDSDIEDKIKRILMGSINRALKIMDKYFKEMKIEKDDQTKYIFQKIGLILNNRIKARRGSL